MSREQGVEEGLTRQWRRKFEAASFAEAGPPFLHIIGHKQGWANGGEVRGVRVENPEPDPW